MALKWVYIHLRTALITVRCESVNVMTPVESRVQDTNFTATEFLVTFRADQTRKSVNPSSRRDVDRVVPDPDRRDFSGNNLDPRGRLK